MGAFIERWSGQEGVPRTVASGKAKGIEGTVTEASTAVGSLYGALAKCVWVGVGGRALAARGGVGEGVRMMGQVRGWAEEVRAWGGWWKVAWPCCGLALMALPHVSSDSPTLRTQDWAPLSLLWVPLI